MAVSYVESINEKYKVTETVANKFNEFDQSVGLTDAVNSAKQTLDRGIATVANAEVVVNTKNAANEKINQFANSITSEVSSRRPDIIEVKEREMVEQPKELNEDTKPEEVVIQQEETQPKQEEIQPKQE